MNDKKGQHFPEIAPHGYKVSIGDTTYIYDRNSNTWIIEETSVEMIRLDSTKPLVIDDPVSEDEITYKFTLDETTESVHTIVYNVNLDRDENLRMSFFINEDENPNPVLKVYRGYRYVFKFETSTPFELGKKFDPLSEFKPINYRTYEDGLRSNEDFTEYYFHVPLDAPDILSYRTPSVLDYPVMDVYDYYKYK